MEYNKICKNTHKAKKEKKTTDFRHTTPVFPEKEGFSMKSSKKQRSQKKSNHKLYRL